MTLRLSCRGLVAARGGRRIAGPLDLDLSGGEALVVTGENGAGKSTLLRTLAGLLPPGAGTIAVEGAAVRDGEAVQGLGEIAHYLGHRNAMKPALSVGENLRFWQRHFGARGGADDRGGGSVEAALEAVALPQAASTPFGYLSAGQQRRAAIARLLVAERPAWILDEPTGALDAASQALFAGLLRRHLAAGGLVVAATHQPLGIDARALRLEPPRSGAALAIGDADLAAAEGWT